MNPMDTLPLELCVWIFKELDPHAVKSAILVDKRWYDVVMDSDMLWRQLCRQYCCQSLVQSDRNLGYNWKDVFKRNYGESGLKKRWLKGDFSNVTSPKDILGIPMCAMSTESWGEILNMELDK